MDVAVDVKVDLELGLDSLSTPVIDLYNFSAAGSIVMPDVVNQTMDDGNQFNIDQVNNLVDQDTNSSLPATPAAAAAADCGTIRARASAWKPRSRAASPGSMPITCERANVQNSADAAINQSAFDQNITQGANIQFNSISIQAAGTTLNDDGDKLVLRSIRAASAARVTFAEYSIAVAAVADKKLQAFAA